MWIKEVRITHGEGVGGRAHFLHIPLHRTELLIKRTGAVPVYRRLQDISAAAVGLKECCVQLHGQVWGEQKGEGKKVMQDNKKK